MARGFNLLLFGILSYLVAASIYFESLEVASTVDKWHPIDVEHLVVVEAAKFAVKEHNRLKKTHLKFQKVIKGQRLNSNGKDPKTELLLFMSAKDGDESHQYWPWCGRWVLGPLRSIWR